MQFRVSSAEQCVRVSDGDKTLWAAAVSTSKYGLGEEPGSWKTPRGRHRICEKIGADFAWGTVFKSRQPTGRVWSPGQETEGDLVLTRILWLEGLEPENQSTRQRYIYFHGTNQEEQIGQPASLGCIRLRNDDMLRLFEYAAVGMEVWIE